MVGEGIPYRRLGYDTLNNFLKSIPDYCRTTRNNKGEVVVTGVADESTRHMQAQSISQLINYFIT